MAIKRREKHQPKSDSHIYNRQNLLKYNLIKFLSKELPVLADSSLKNQMRYISELDEDDLKDFEDRLLRKAYREITEADRSFKPYPTDEELCREGYKLGYIKNSNQPFLIEKRFLGEHGIIYGRSGGGKTTKILNPLLVQTLKDPTIRNFIFNVEKREDFIPFIRDYPELIWIDCSKTFPFNFLRPPENADLFGYQSDFLELISGIFWIGILGRNFLIKTLKRVVFENGTLRGNKDNYPTLKELLDKLKASQKEIRYQGFSIIDQYNKLVTKLETLVYTLPKEAIESKINLDISKVIDRNVIWDLTALPLESAQLIISGILLQTYYYKSLNKCEFMHLFIFDEAQTIFGIPEKASMGGEIAYEKYIRKVRSASIGLWFACQDVSKINQSLSNNVFTKISLSLSSGVDVDIIRRDMQLDYEAIKYFFSKAKDDEALIKLSGGNFKRPTIIKLEPLFLKRLSEEELLAHMEKCAKYISLASSDSESDKLKKDDGIIENLSANALRYYKSIQEKPFLNVTQRNKIFGFSSRSTQQAVDELSRTGLLSKAWIQIKENKKPALFWHLSNEYGGKYGQFESYFWKFVARLYYQSKDNVKKVTEERSLLGSSHTVDLLIETNEKECWAWECTIHFDNLISNIEKCIKDGYARIIIAVRNQDKDKAINIIESSFKDNPIIEVVPLTDFYKEELVLNG